MEEELNEIVVDTDIVETVKLGADTLKVTDGLSDSMKGIADMAQNEFASGLAGSLTAISVAFANIGKTITETLLSVDFSKIFNGLREALIPIRYIDVLSKSKWPLFLIDDEELRQNILDCCKDKTDIEAIKRIVLNYCDNDFLESIEEDWKSCVAIREERKAVLSEAILMHKQGYYFASTSILACQVYGIISDITRLMKISGLELDDDGKNFVSEYFKIKRENVDSEKGRLLQMTLITESGQLLWEAMARYLKDEILCSSDSKKRWESQPIRNKICHGVQLNFGTEEHSLKAILTIDMLIQLAYEIYRVAECRNNAETEE